MRVLEPRILLDAASVETALDIAGQAAHNRLADDYFSNSRSAEDVPADLDDVVEAVAPELPSQPFREIVFIDAGVPDQEDLISALDPNVQVVVLDSQSDGVAQMLAALEEGSSYDAVHIFAHGSAGQLNLGDAQLTAQSISGHHSDDLAKLGQRLSENGDILIYGCSFGEGVEGKQAAAYLAQATGADIAASDDLTGHESLAGDWDLEVNVGAIERAAFTAPEWKGVLGDDFVISASGPPTISHTSNGINGTVGTVAQWDGAVTFDPGSGQPIETYDLRATILSQSENASAAFMTSGDDMQVIVTNTGEEVGTNGGTRVVEGGTVTVLWEIFVAGTDDRADPHEINITLSDLDGASGSPIVAEGVGISLANLSAYTTENTTNLTITDDDDELLVTGTQTGGNDPNSQIGAYWANANQFLLTYNTNTTSVAFQMDGDGDAIFTNPVTQHTQRLDLNGDGAGQDHAVVYLNGLPAGPVADTPIALVDLDVSIFDIDNIELTQATIRLTNAQVGDQFNVDNSILGPLGISTEIDNSVAGEITLTLSGDALIQHYEAALQAVTYENTAADGDLVLTARTVAFEISDGLISTSGAETTITFGVVDGSPNSVPNVYVASEDVAITVGDPADGLLANDRDPDGPMDGSSLSILSAQDSAGNPISMGGGASVLPSGSAITLLNDGTFSYLPALHYSGNEYIQYTVTDGTFTSTSWVTFDVLPVVDQVSLTVNQPVSDSDEDAPSAPISIDVSSPDPSEFQNVMISNIPSGVILTDGTNTFSPQGLVTLVDVTNWDLSQIRVLPIENSDADITINILATSSDADGSTSFDTRSVTFEINAVADVAIATVDAVGGAVDADVQIGAVISAQLFDDDGSEAITEILISNIPVDGKIFVSGVETTVTGGMVSLSLAQIGDIVFSPPQVGVDAVYNMGVSVTTTEINPENGVAAATQVNGPIPLVVDLNSDDDPVAAVNDSATTGAGIPVILPVLFNDFIPDGGGVVTHIDGQIINSSTSVTLANGLGVVTMNLAGDISYTPAGTFSGQAVFAYSMQDLDGSTDDATVRVEVKPVWNISGSGTAAEGGDASYQLNVFGSHVPGETVSTEIDINHFSSAANDVGDLAAALTASIAANGDAGFSSVGNVLSYTAPLDNYPATYNAANTFIDISGEEDIALSLGPNGVANTGIGFDFNFFGQTFDTLYVSANGYVTFGSPISLSDNVAIDGTAFGGRPAIAALWDDLNQAGGDILVKSTNAAVGLREFVIQWNNVTQQGGGANTGTFQIVLSEADGSVTVNYQDITFGNGFDGGSGATVGIEGPGGFFTQFSQNGSQAIADGSSVTFSMPKAVSPVLNLDLPIVDDTDFEVTEQFSLALSNSVGSLINTEIATTIIDVSDNSAPNAVDDSTVTDEVAVVNINVLTNPAGADSDPEGHLLSLTGINGANVTGGDTITLPSGALVVVGANGNLAYDPNGQFNLLPIGGMANDTFAYTVTDQFGASSVANVTIQIDGINQVAIIDLSDDGTNLIVNKTTSIEVLDPATSIVDAAAAVIDGDDSSFTEITMTLGAFLQPGEEEVTIAGFTLVHGTPANSTVSFGGVTLAIDFDASGVATISDNSGAEMSNALVNSIIASTQYQNTSGDDFTGVRTVTFAVNDGDDVSQSAIAYVDVVGTNTLPIANNDGATPFVVAEEGTVTIAAATLLANDSDPDGDTISLLSVLGGVNGTAVLNGSGDVEFTPNADFNGSTSFTYTISDGEGGTATASVFVSVTPVVDAPRVDLNGAVGGLDYSTTYIEDGAAVQFVSIDGSVLNPDGGDIDSVTVTLTNGFVGDQITVGTLPGGITALFTPTNVQTGLIADGPVTITLTNAASSSDYTAALAMLEFQTVSDAPDLTDRSITVSADANSLTSLVATTTVTVVPTNDDPTANDDGIFDVLEDQSFVISPAGLLANDVDGDLDGLMVTSLQNAVNGSVTLLGNGDVRFVPTGDYFGPASFEYIISDGNGGTDTGLVQLNVISVNDITQIDLDTTDIGNGTSATFTEDAGAIAIIGPDVLITDNDDTQLSSITITVTNGQVGDQLFAGALPPGISAIVNPTSELVAAGPIVMTLNGAATIGAYQTALQAVMFENLSDRPDVADRMIEVVTNDGEDDSAPVTSIVSVIPVNDAPQALGDGVLTVLEDNVLTISPSTLLANDSDPDLDALTITTVDNASIGTVVINGAGNIIFTPPANYSGAASFDYTIDDGNGETAIAQVTIGVVPVNDAPTIDLDGNTIGIDYTTAFVENNPAISIVDATLALADVDNANLQSITVVLTNGFVGDQLAHGMLPPGIVAAITPTSALVVDGPISLTLAGNAPIADYINALQAVTFVSVSENPDETQRTIQITGDDGDMTTAIAVTSIDVTAVNDTPIVGADGPFTTIENQPITLALSTLLGNDNDPDGDVMNVTSVHNAANGTVVLNGSGGAIFTPDAGYFGAASFDYDVEDGNGGNATATVTITVESINDAPELDLNGANTGTNITLNYTENDAPIQLLGADFDIFDQDDTHLEGAQLVLTNGQIGDHLNAPANVGPVTISITPVGAMAAPGSATITLSGTATIAEYEDAIRAITYESTSENPDTTNRVIEVRANDGELDSIAVVATISITSVNDVPIAVNDTGLSIAEDGVLSLSPSALMANDSDAEGALSLISVANPVNGTVTINTAGNVVFTPNANYFGPASFEYTIEDTDGATATAVAEITVTSVNDAPTSDLNGAGDAGTGYVAVYTENDAPISIVDVDVALDDLDDTHLESANVVLVNGQVGDLVSGPASVGPVSISITPNGSLVASGTVTVSLSGNATLAEYEAALLAVTYSSVSETPATVNRQFSITVNDGDLDSPLAISTIQVVSVNDVPVALPETGLVTAEDVPMMISPLANDSDADGDLLQIVEINGVAVVPQQTVTVANGTVTLSLDGTELEYIPSLDYNGPATFSYTVGDGQATDTANVDISVTPVNDIPRALDDGPIVLVEDGFVDFDPVAANDFDPEGDAISLSQVNGTAVSAGSIVTVSNGVVAIGADGQTWTFTPDADYFGTVIVPYSITDGTDEDQANVTFEVTPVNDPVVVVSSPAPQSFFDGAIVNLPLAQHFVDVDGDVLSFSATGLPVGLSINATTGIVSGQIDGSASQSGPYSVTVEATDGLSPQATTSFQIDVANTIPVAVAGQTLPLNEGDAFVYDVSALFSDADGDNLALSVVGLPAWASFNGSTGEITGTVPTDAALFGSITVSLEANDGEGGLANTSVVLDPSNVAPVALAQPTRLIAQELDSIFFDVAANFADGGADNDPLTFNVTGLPDGLVFSPSSGLISGDLASGTTRPAAYFVVMTADDGQGGTIDQVLTIRVGDVSFIDPSNIPDDTGQTNETDRERSVLNTSIMSISDTVDTLSTLNGTQSLNEDSSILADALTQAQSLSGLHDASSVSGALPEGAFASLGGMGSWIGSGELNALSDEHSYGALANDGDDLSIDAYRRGSALFIEVVMKDGLRDELSELVVSVKNGDALPEWIKVIRPGFLSANPPADMQMIDLAFVLKDSDPRIVRVNLSTGDVVDLEAAEDKPRLPVSNDQNSPSLRGRISD